MPTWESGVTIFILLIAIAFTGYVLPWGQMSFWGATVITNLFTVLPRIGLKVVELMWGARYICTATLKRFFVIHFLIPFVLLVLILVHLAFLHQTGSSNILGVDISGELVTFYPYYLYKDVLGIIGLIIFILRACLLLPDLFRGPQNFEL